MRTGWAFRTFHQDGTPELDIQADDLDVEVVRLLVPHPENDPDYYSRVFLVSLGVAPALLASVGKECPDRPEFYLYREQI